MKHWRCVICGYEEEGSAPPDVCPVCGAASEYFEETAIIIEPVSAHPGMRNESIVVVGAGVAGVAAAESARAVSPEAKVTLLSAESDSPYYRLNLTRYLAGEIAREELPLHPAEWYANSRIQLRLGAVASRLDLERKRLWLSDNSDVTFDRLVLTAGANPFVPPLEGVSKHGVICMRTRTDAETAIAMAAKGYPCVVIGGGILGLEVAGALARRGARVTVLEAGPFLLPRQLNRRGAELLARHAQSAGIELRFEAKTTGISGSVAAEAVQLAGGTIIPAGLVIIAAGIRPNVAMAADAGLSTRSGILVDDQMTSSNRDVFAAGDIAEHAGVVYGLWGPAQTQGKIAGSNAAGSAVHFTPVPRSNTLKVLGVGLFSAGEIEARDHSTTEIETERDARYFRLLFREGRMTGAILLGDVKHASRVLQAIEHREDLSPLLSRHPTAMDLLEAIA